MKNVGDTLLIEEEGISDSLEIDNFQEEQEELINEDLSESCKLFLEDYNLAIQRYLKIQKDIDQNGDNFTLILARNDAEESMNSMLTSPDLFQCSSNNYFQTQLDSLNALKDF